MLPHVQLFDSWDGLLSMLRKADLAQISDAMRRTNKAHKRDLLDKWR